MDIVILLVALLLIVFLFAVPGLKERNIRKRLDRWHREARAYKKWQF